ncbi:MAG TPA: tRNA pseudouridine(38-40) synthase TruA [Bacteroidota bacterium]|nr:tRNA pseudouridine(38-40) synthase TruA [Bacteroidota bacterium]
MNKRYPPTNRRFEKPGPRIKSNTPGTQKFKLLIEYEGTRYSGWQIQKNARTVQGDLTEAARKVFQTHELELYGSGRTDAGVHAIGQVAHLAVKTMLAPHIVRMKINDELPADINIIDVEKALPEFHARHDAVRRTYLYQISRRRTALGKRYVWWVKDELNIAKMRDAAKVFVGFHDFQSFSADDPEEKSTKVDIDELLIEERGTLILIRIGGSHFLWKLVRQMVGVLVEAGRGNLTSNDIAGYLRNSSAEPAQYTAPPSGLFLERVFYKGDKREEGLKPVLNV